MKTKLTLESLTVTSFATLSGGSLLLEQAATQERSCIHSECVTCGIACTAIDCDSQNYSDCGSCGIACTAIDCPSKNHSECPTCEFACSAINC